MSEPVVDKPTIPPEYGDPKDRLEWAEVERRLERAGVYWIASTRPDGRPHVVPRDGMWLDGALYCTGTTQSRKHWDPAAMVELAECRRELTGDGCWN